MTATYGGIILNTIKMTEKYEINALEKEESWRLFRYIGELVEGFDKLSGIDPAVTIYGAAVATVDQADYQNARQIAYLLGKQGFNIVTGGGPGMGNQVLIICFVVVVIGGIGSIRGALLAALLIGIVDTFGKVVFPQAAGVLVYLLMALVLLWKPSGLFKAG